MCDFDKAILQKLDLYCDLTELQFDAVESAERGIVVELSEIHKRYLGELIGADLRLNSHGKEVYERAMKVITGWTEPSEFEPKELIKLNRISGISLAHRARRITGQFYNSGDMKLMMNLAKVPGQAIRHLRRTFGQVDSQMERGIITQGEFRGDPIYLTEASKILLHTMAREVG